MKRGPLQRVAAALRRGMLGGLASCLPFAATAQQTPPDVSAQPPVAIDAIPPGPSLASRLDEIRRRVETALRYPPLARRRGVAGEALVGFEIGGHGEARAIRLERSSGSKLLDDAALRAVGDAAPLPAVYGRVEVPVRFDLEATP